MPYNTKHHNSPDVKATQEVRFENYEMAFVPLHMKMSSHGNIFHVFGPL